LGGFGEFAQGMDRLADNINKRRAQRLENDRWRAAAAVTAWGLLGPGDPPPLPSDGDKVYDYRGITTPAAVQMLHAPTPDGRLFPVGDVLEVRAPPNFHPGPAFPVGVPARHLGSHAAIVGRSGSGKTRFVVVPWIHSAMRSSSVVSLDAKGDMLDLIREYVEQHGRLGVPAGKWDYTDPDNSMCWNWIDDIDDEHSLDAALTAVLGRADKQGNSDPFFHHRDRQVLGGALQLAKPLGLRSATEILAFLARQENVEDAIADHPGSPGALALQSAVGDLDPMDYRKSTQGVLSALQLLSTPKIDKVTTGARHRLSLDDLLSRRRMLVVVAPVAGGQTSQIMSGLFLNLLAQRIYRRFRDRPGQVFLFIDEAPRFVSRFDFEELLSVARSAGVSVILALQDVAQFKEEHERSTIIANCATWLSLGGVEESTVKFLQGRLGKHNVAFWSHGGHADRPGHDLRKQAESRPVLGEREIAFPPGQRGAILHMKDSSLPSSPVLVDLEPQPWTWEAKVFRGG
jgi:type IV secretory pathway TraG/TraD family ATPase VirD4